MENDDPLAAPKAIHDPLAAADTAEPETPATVQCPNCGYGVTIPLPPLPETALNDRGVLSLMERCQCQGRDHEPDCPAKPANDQS